MHWAFLYAAKICTLSHLMRGQLQPAAVPKTSQRMTPRNTPWEARVGTMGGEYSTLGAVDRSHGAIQIMDALNLMTRNQKQWHSP